jgi:hypothetical protein
VVLQPVIQLGTAIHGKGFSGGALNRVQKPVRLHKNSSPSHEKLPKNVYLAIRILANRPFPRPVAAVTPYRPFLAEVKVDSFDS